MLDEKEITFFFDFKSSQLGFEMSDVVFYKKPYAEMKFHFNLFEDDWNQPHLAEYLTQKVQGIMDLIHKMNMDHNQYDYGMPALISDCSLDRYGRRMTFSPGRERSNLIKMIDVIYTEIIRPLMWYPRAWETFRVNWDFDLTDGTHRYFEWLTSVNCSKLIPAELEQHLVPNA